jgi:HlyD family secretion protein
MSIQTASHGRTEIVPVGLKPPAPSDLVDSPVREMQIGYIIIFAFFVVGLGWASIARLDASASATGSVSVSGNRQTVQHRDGGIVQEIDVKEGDHVVKGQVLIKLAAAEVQAQETALANQLIDLKAQKARLEAEINGTAIVRPADFTALPPEEQPLADKAMALQEKQLNARRGSLAASAAVLREQAAEAQSQQGGATAQSSAVDEQRKSLQQQLDSTRDLAAKGYASRNTVRSLERALAQLEGSTADFNSRAAAASQQMAQAHDQTITNERHFIEDSAGTLRDTSFQINEMEPKWRAAVDQVERTTIRAPMSGKVVGLHVFSTGGVIAPGEKILDIVPDSAPLVIKANFAPADIDGVYAGREAEVKFLSIHERDLPVIVGKVSNVSADSLTDDQTHQTFFTAEIVVPDDQLAKLRAVRGGDTGIRAGVPVQVLVKLRKRTALQYMLDPVFEAFGHSMHEQ